MKFLIPLFLLFSYTGYSQIGVGEWRMHLAERIGIDIAAGNGKVVEAVQGGLVLYDISAGEVRTKDRVKGLAESDVTCVYYDSHSTSFFVGYANGNIDQVLSDESVVNIPGVKLAQITGNKRINKFSSADGRVFAATGFGVVVLNGSLHEISDTYYPDTTSNSFNDVCIVNDSIYALQSNRLFRAKKSSAFLADPTQWHLDSRFPEPVNAHYGELAVAGNNLYYSYIDDAYGQDSVLLLTSGGHTLFVGDQFSMEIRRITALDDKIAICLNEGLPIYNLDRSLAIAFDNYGNGIFIQASAIAIQSGYYFISDSKNGLIRKTGQYDALFLAKDGPPKNEFFSVTAQGEKLVFTGGILDPVTFNYRLSGAYAFEDESWTLFDNSLPNWPANNWDIGVAAINPNDPTQVALAGQSVTPLILMSGNTVANSYSPSNSGLAVSSVGNGNTCISSMQYDASGNLWMANCYSQKPLKVRTASGEWAAMLTGSNAADHFTGDLVIDQNNIKWFSVSAKGIIGLNDNGTPTNPNDDTHAYLTTGVGSGDLPSANVNALAIDQDNELWIGTEDGFAILYNPSSAFGSGQDVSRILIDFEGNVEYLLGETNVTDIAIDGANRKWIGTDGSGVFLLSASGQDVIANYTTENSPLLSDQILDMDFNLTTGELFIVTSDGLISLRTDATAEDENYETTTVFPNPVNPDYTGVITIQGIRANSDVHITDIAGNVVYKTTSNGGTATWNGKRLTGEDVTSGVYIIWTAVDDTEEKAKKVGKVVVIR